MNPPNELEKLRKISHQLGIDPLLVQGAGGNTSIKENNNMWIKASGTQLSQALKKDIFVQVDTTAMLNDVRTDPELADHTQKYLVNAEALKPSIETSLHAVFPHRIVLHVHCVNTIVHAIQNNPVKLIADKLDGIRWAFVPYVKPGGNLAKLVDECMGSNIDAVILGNHGLIVGGESVDEACDRVYHVHRSLQLEELVYKSPDISALKACAGEKFIPAHQDDSVHQLALHPDVVRMAVTGSLYPDHVIFCGIGAISLPEGIIADDFCDNFARMPEFLIVPGFGVLFRKDSKEPAKIMARCLCEVLLRVPQDAKLVYLTEQENFELLNWDAEKYRREMNG